LRAGPVGSTWPHRQFSDHALSLELSRVARVQPALRAQGRGEWCI